MAASSLGKRVIIWGLGKTGFESARFLKEEGFDPFVWDQNDSDEVRERADGLAAQGIPVAVGRAETDRLWHSDWLLISPGVPPSSPVYQEVRRRGLPVLSEIEVASLFCPSERVIGVTGSCGKTTVTTLLGRVFEKVKGKAFACGNLGNPWIGEIRKIRPDDFVVVEISSFQLAHCETFRPKAGVLLNLSPNHLNWHRDMEDYASAKWRLFRNQGPRDFAVLRREDENRFFRNAGFRAQKIYLDDLCGVSSQQGLVMNPNERVVHVVARLFDCPAEAVRQVLSEFRGIEHRLEKVTEAEGITFVNDSKCTTPASLVWALGKFADRSVLLIAGGRPKSEDFPVVRPLLEQKVRETWLLGEARPLLGSLWQGACSMHEADHLRRAVEEAARKARPGDTVLLSPGCASFDMFKNYEERGRQFKQLVQELTNPVNAEQTRISKADLSRIP